MEERSGFEQGRTQVAEGSKLKLQQENREGGENSKALAGVDSPPSIAMRGELQGGSRDSGASPFRMDYSEIPPSPPPQAPVQGPDRAVLGISKAAEVAVPAIDSVKSKQTQSPGDCVDNRNLLTRPKGKSSVEGRINDSHDPDGFSKKLDLIVPAPTGSHSSHEDEHGSWSQLQMPRAKGRSGRSASIPWIGPPCSRCKSSNFSMYTDANAESVVNRMHYQCNNCKQHLYTRENVRSFKMSNLKPSTQAASNSNMKLMPPPSYTRKPNACLPDSQDTAFYSAQTTLPLRSSSFSDKLEDDHPSRESNLQLVVAPEPEERFPMEIVEAKGPFHLSAGLQEPRSKQSAKGNQKEPSFANDGFSVKSLHDSICIRGHRSSPLEENKKGSGGGTVSDDGRPSNGLPCTSCKSTNTRFCLPGHYYCDNCRKYWTLGHLQQHQVQLPSKQSPKGKEKEKKTPYEDADQYSGMGLRDSSRGARSLPLHGSEDGVGGSNEGPLNALSCSRCKSTVTRLCTYGVFCDACGKHTPFAGTRDHEHSGSRFKVENRAKKRASQHTIELCLEYPLRDVVLPFLVPQVHFSDPWEWDKPEKEHPVTIATIDCIRGTANSWKHFVEGTAEWGAISLARHEFDMLVPPVWVPEDEFVLYHFEKYRSLFTKSWTLQRPLVEDRWRTADFEDLTLSDLAGLCLALQQDSLHWVETPAAGCLQPSPTLWITPEARGGAC